MARVHILKWLYKHSPVNFYSVTENAETIIKSINNTYIGYKFDYEFSQSKINSLRKVTKWFKRLSTMFILLMYIVIIYCIILPNYKFFSAGYEKIAIMLAIVIGITIVIA